MYNEKVMKIFQNPEHMGDLKGANAIGQVGNMSCGDIMKIYLKINENEIIEDATFKTFGCVAAIVSSSIACGLVIGKTIDEALNFAKEYGVKLAVKSAVSIITDGEEIYLNTTGCAGMAKAGSGDVLSGLIAGTIARNSCELESLLSALYLFGKAGEKAQEKESEFTMTASEIIENFASVIKDLQQA